VLFYEDFFKFLSEPTIGNSKRYIKTLGVLSGTVNFYLPVPILVFGGSGY